MLLAALPAAGHAQTLGQLIGQALADHPTIRLQRLQGDAAQAGVDSAKWQFYPTASVAVENAYSNSSAAFFRTEGAVATIGLQQPLWTGGRLTAGLEKAEAGVVASAASLEETQEQVAVRVVQNYGDWLAATLKVRAYDHSLITHERLREQVQRRIASGASAGADLVLVEARLQSTIGDRMLAQSQGDIALAHLGQLLGRPVVVSRLVESVAAPRPLEADAGTAVDMARRLSTTVRKAQAQADVQKAAIAERRADLAPEVYVRAERQYGSHPFGASPAASRVFIGMSSHFGAGLSSLSNVRAAVAQHEAALAAVAVEVRAVTEQILADDALARAGTMRLPVLQFSREASGQVAASYDRQFLAGRKTWSDVMNATRETTQVEIQLAELQAALVTVTWRLAIFTRGLNSLTGAN